jgi:hypothetical protein
MHLAFVLVQRIQSSTAQLTTIKHRRIIGKVYRKAGVYLIIRSEDGDNSKNFPALLVNLSGILGRESK